MMRAALIALAAAALAAAPARAATVQVVGDALRVEAVPGEVNLVTVEPPGVLGGFGVRDTGGTPPTPRAGCVSTFDPAVVECFGNLTRVAANLGDFEDSLSVSAVLALSAAGGDGDDTITGSPLADTLDGGIGFDQLNGGEGPDTVLGGDGDDTLVGSGGDDVLDGHRGADSADGGAGNDRITLRDRKADHAVCGRGRDRVRAEVLDELDFACEQVDYGSPGKVGRLRPLSRPRRFVRIPGQRGARIDKRILKNVLWMIRKYKVRITEGYALSGHARFGEHPLGLAVDIIPGPGGSWRKVDKLARWAERRQNRPRPPFRWVGYNGDFNHGRGNHLHLSWMHSRGRFGRPVRTTWVFVVRRRAGAAGPPAAAGMPAPGAALQGGRPEY